ncbi:NADH-quinone oxidoreductase subunit NuoN [Chitinasiproducens palmae]|uniref:NADH-quinone oxidoreductase subunit N n=1 Tax=Chitinasiproducens palmae TaxID=1770053 RepID=A0A1H2PSK2_9BURK|nr:NADH-quinone oxidoreductase subunit NuoN [Chitinasiproducens palmae]SDV49996.1 NADH dehydrogenase subunit N [Chitinasiproducens palmae]
MQNGNLTLLLPEALVLLAAILCLMNDALSGVKGRGLTHAIAVVASLAAGCIFLVLAGDGVPRTLFDGSYVVDGLASVLKATVSFGFAATLIYGRRYIVERDLFKGEFYILALFSLLGQMLMISGSSFLTLYLGLELMSLSLYALIALRRKDGLATESALKYYVLGALASGFLLYGISMTYGATGSLLLGDVFAAIDSGRINHTMLVFGVVFIVVGVTFKLGAAPFHMWVPDVYQGAPTAVTLLVGAGPKVAAFAFAFRFLVNGMLPLAGDWQQMLIIIAALSMIIGNVMGVVQSNIKRMLAYSAISHQGFVLLGLLAGVFTGGDAHSITGAYGSALFYSVTYLLTTLGAFAVLMVLSRGDFEVTQIDDLKGLNKRSPWTAFVMLILMFSFAGIPPTVGFYAKLAVLSATVHAGLTWLAVLAVLTSLVGAFYYLRVVKVMYFDVPQDELPLDRDGGARVTLTANGLAVLALGLLPGPLMTACLWAVQRSLGQ